MKGSPRPSTKKPFLLSGLDWWLARLYTTGFSQTLIPLGKDRDEEKKKSVARRRGKREEKNGRVCVRISYRSWKPTRSHHLVLKKEPSSRLRRYGLVFFRSGKKKGGGGGEGDLVLNETTTTLFGFLFSFFPFAFLDYVSLRLVLFVFVLATTHVT